MAKKTMATKTTKGASAETKLIKELAKILNDTDLSEIEMEKGDLRIRVARGGTQIAAIAPALAPAAIAPAATNEAPVTSAPSTENAEKSPMVGTVYLSPSPDEDAFVKVGDSVKEGDTILLIEAMKTFNPIKATRSGKITDILVTDGQPVEFDENLMIIG